MMKDPTPRMVMKNYERNVVSAGLVYIYLNGYLENELHIQSIDTYSCLSSFYQRVIENCKLIS